MGRRGEWLNWPIAFQQGGGTGSTWPPEALSVALCRVFTRSMIFSLRAQTPKEDPTVPDGGVLKKVRLTQPPKQDAMTDAVVCVTWLHEKTGWIGSPGQGGGWGWRWGGAWGVQAMSQKCLCVSVSSRREVNVSLTLWIPSVFPSGIDFTPLLSLFAITASGHQVQVAVPSVPVCGRAEFFLSFFL